jgi:hypothetical protein
MMPRQKLKGRIAVGFIKFDGLLPATPIINIYPGVLEDEIE